MLSALLIISGVILAAGNQVDVASIAKVKCSRLPKPVDFVFKVSKALPTGRRISEEISATCAAGSSESTISVPKEIFEDGISRIYLYIEIPSNQTEGLVANTTQDSALSKITCIPFTRARLSNRRRHLRVCGGMISALAVKNPPTFTFDYSPDEAAIIEAKAVASGESAGTFSSDASTNQRYQRQRGSRADLKKSLGRQPGDDSDAAVSSGAASADSAARDATTSARPTADGGSDEGKGAAKDNKDKGEKKGRKGRKERSERDGKTDDVKDRRYERRRNPLPNHIKDPLLNIAKARHEREKPTSSDK